MVTYKPDAACRNSKSSIVIRARDYYLLDDQQYLNDVLMDFYFKMLGSGRSELISRGQASRCHFFSSLFIRLLLDEFKGKSKAPLESRAHQWTKNIPDLFDREFLLIPVHHSMHWSLAVVCFAGSVGDTERALGKQARVIYMDSLGRKQQRVVASIRNFLEYEWRQRYPGVPKKFNTETCVGHMPVVPIQSNDWDCGLFVLHYAQQFAKDPEMVIERVISKEKKCLEHWFKSADVQGRKRAEVQDLIHSLKCQEPLVPSQTHGALVQDLTCEDLAYYPAS
eukprot:TRINITY_DN27693_c0_g1_i3.p1 TRINITY_DN27693_c0_g1~~TRINITY_DN27693_c0_g1_i3.p1  ORF type:complete len:280 (+),score=53.93 TRINITY_DN27693_c0_g1_i3:375-1214(+)